MRTQRAPQTKGPQLTVKCYVRVREHPFQEAGEDASVGLDWGLSFLNHHRLQQPSFFYRWGNGNVEKGGSVGP